MSREVQITFDCVDPAAQAEFWAAVLGYVVQPPPAGFDSWDQALDAWGVPAEHRNDRSALVDPDARGPRMFLQKVPGRQPRTVSTSTCAPRPASRTTSG